MPSMPNRLVTMQGYQKISPTDFYITWNLLCLGLDLDYLQSATGLHWSPSSSVVSQTSLRGLSKGIGHLVSAKPWNQILGYSIQEFLEYQYFKGMNWLTHEQSSLQQRQNKMQLRINILTAQGCISDEDIVDTSIIHHLHSRHSFLFRPCIMLTNSLKI